MPTRHEWSAYAQWSRQYNSDLIHLKLPLSNLIVINTLKAASDLLDKRSAIYSDRPRLPMMNELMGWDGFLVLSYGPLWRASRRMFHQYFRENTRESYRPHESKAAHEMLYRLAHNPEDYADHVRLMSGALILNITYGLDIQSAGDPYIRMAEESALALATAGRPSTFLVNTLPFLKHVPDWFPGAGFKAIAKEVQKINMVAIGAPFQFVKDAMANGVDNHSVTSQALQECQGNEEMEYLAREVSGMAYYGGADTTVHTLLTFFLAMVLHPDVVRKAHEELDRVVGQDRLPTFSDRPSLPYICAIVNETLRWHPLLPLGFPHKLMEDDIYEGMFLPAGSMVMANSWSILHDPAIYKDPEPFNPDRFLKDGELDPDVMSPGLVAFGFGRRICPGRFVALDSLFLNMACVLASFDIGKAIDEKGNSITPVKDFASGTILSGPLPFKCSIKPRSQLALSLVDRAYETHHSPS